MEEEPPATGGSTQDDCSASCRHAQPYEFRRRGGRGPGGFSGGSPVPILGFGAVSWAC